eukprot:3744570-Alexandrium_andersonii.AAC.1
MATATAMATAMARPGKAVQGRVRPCQARPWPWRGRVQAMANRQSPESPSQASRKGRPARPVADP